MVFIFPMCISNRQGGRGGQIIFELLVELCYSFVGKSHTLFFLLFLENDLNYLFHAARLFKKHCIRSAKGGRK